MALVEELLDVALVQGPSDDQHHVVDHVAVCAVVHEGREGLRCLAAHVLPVLHQLLRALVHDRRGVQRGRLVLEVGPVVGAAQMELDVIQGLALRQVVVVCCRQQTPLVPTNDGLKVPILHVEVEGFPAVHGA